MFSHCCYTSTSVTITATGFSLSALFQLSQMAVKFAHSDSVFMHIYCVPLKTLDTTAASCMLIRMSCCLVMSCCLELYCLVYCWLLNCTKPNCQKNPKKPQYWILLVSDATEKRSFSNQEIASLNPDDSTAIRGLEARSPINHSNTSQS